VLARRARASVRTGHGTWPDVQQIAGWIRDVVPIQADALVALAVYGSPRWPLALIVNGL